MDNDGILKFDKNIYIDQVSEENLLKKGEILFNNTNSQELVGKTSYYELDGEYCCSNHITRIMINSDFASAKYIKEILAFYQRNKIFYNICTNWNNQSGVNYSVLKNLSIPMPDFTIQNEIVLIMENAYREKKEKEDEVKKLLSKIDDYLLDELGIKIPKEKENTLENRKFYVNSSKVIGNRFDPYYYSPLYASIENAILESSYAKTKLLRIAIIESGVVYSADDETDTGNAILRANNIDLRTNTLDLDDIKYINSNISIPNSKKLCKNDIFICTASGSKEHAGKVAFIDYDTEYYYGGFMSVIRLKSEECLPEYLFEYMASSVFRNLIQKHLGGTNINNVSVKILNNMNIILPTIQEQKEIIKEIRTIRNKVKQLEFEAINLLENAKEKVENLLLGGEVL